MDLDGLYDTFCGFGRWNKYYRSRLRKGTRTESVSFIINDRKLVSFLSSFGYSKNRDMGLALSIVDDRYRYMWYRGLYDGDGCFYSNRKQYLTQVSISSNFGCDWSRFIEDFPYFRVQRVTSKNTGHKSSSVRISSTKDVKSFMNTVYPDGYDGIGLIRKFREI